MTTIAHSTIHRLRIREKTTLCVVSDNRVLPDEYPFNILSNNAIKPHLIVLADSNTAVRNNTISSPNWQQRQAIGLDQHNGV